MYRFILAAMAVLPLLLLYSCRSGAPGELYADVPIPDQIEGVVDTPAEAAALVIYADSLMRYLNVTYSQDSSLTDSMALIKHVEVMNHLVLFLDLSDYDDMDFDEFTEESKFDDMEELMEFSQERFEDHINGDTLQLYISLAVLMKAEEFATIDFINLRRLRESDQELMKNYWRHHYTKAYNGFFLARTLLGFIRLYNDESPNYQSVLERFTKQYQDAIGKNDK